MYTYYHDNDCCYEVGHKTSARLELHVGNHYIFRKLTTNLILRHRPFWTLSCVRRFRFPFGISRSTVFSEASAFVRRSSDLDQVNSHRHIHTHQLVSTCSLLVLTFYFVLHAVHQAPSGGRNNKLYMFICTILTSFQILIRLIMGDPNAERTFIMIKPDGVQRGLVGKIIKRFETKGFKLVAMKFVWVSVSKCRVGFPGFPCYFYFWRLVCYLTTINVYI